jgi:hypothetical protein
MSSCTWGGREIERSLHNKNLRSNEDEGISGLVFGLEVSFKELFRGRTTLAAPMKCLNCYCPQYPPPTYSTF